MASLDELDRRLDQLRRIAANLEGRRDQLEARDAELTRNVGLAKGRLALKPKVDAFLDALQAAAHERTVGSYSRLLTAIAQDVLPQDLKIGLELYTERGLPALDIFAQKGTERVDLLEGCGGSLTNVVSLGLRTIATVKSGMRKFLALDEPDCWVKPDRVPAYYRVLKQMSERMDFQAVVISHHDISLFDSGINVIAVSGTPEEGLSVDTRAGAAVWADDETPGIRALVLRNFASYKDARIPLAPGVNAIIGDNNIGKSRIMRMFRSVAYAGPETSDDDIRHGERRAEVEIHLEKGRVLHWSREKRRNPVTLWRLVEADGSIVELKGVRCEGGGKQAPEWVAEVLGIARVDGLDLQLAHQKFPVFLLGESASRRAAVLSIGRESKHLRAMIKAHKEACTSDQTTVRQGEKEIADVRRHRAVLEGVAPVIAVLDSALQEREAALQTAAEAAELEATLRRIEEASQALARAEAEAEAVGALADPPDLSAELALARELDRTVSTIARLQDELAKAAAEAELLEALPAEAPVLVPSDDMAVMGRRIRDAECEYAEADAVAKALEDLPDEAPTLADVRELLAAVERGARLAADHAKAVKEADEATAGEQAVALEMAEVLTSIGNLCPLCGSHVEHEHILAAGAAAMENA